MREWWAPLSFTIHQNETTSVWGRRRGERPTNPASAGNLVALPILLLVLGMPSHHREGYLWLCAAGTVSEYLQENSTRGSELDGYAPPPQVATSRGRLLPTNLVGDVSKVPSVRESNSAIYNNADNMQDALRGSSARHGANDGSQIHIFRRKSPSKTRRNRRGAADPAMPTVSPTYWTAQPTQVSSEQSLFFRTVDSFTLVPDARKASMQFHSDSGTSYARTSGSLPPTTPILEEATSHPWQGGLSSRPNYSASPSLPAGMSSAHPSKPSHTPTRWSTSATLPTPATDLADVTPAPRETMEETTVATQHDSKMPGTSTSSPLSTVGNVVSGSFQPGTDLARAPATQGELSAETQATMTPHAPSTEVLFNNSVTSTTRAGVDLEGPQGGGAEGPKNKQSNERVYTIVTRIKTQPSILIIMPCLVGLALLGLVAAGIKRCVLHRRLAHMVELVDPEKLKQDKGYTIENPMVKTRRSYLERQMDRTLRKVNKTESTNSSNSSRNTANSKRDAKVHMEIATISDGSLRRPGRPLHRSASERVAPTWRRSSAGYTPSLRAECRCCCRCAVCGRKGRPLRNGSVPLESSTATTRL
ncbi:uncharacterized protein LOC110978051 [Acanthaster planci]|uniref:Uncharacterized protein LOC110978051 n=1 Tax=Acanthaster planci TaxID=133434 RepID=A0A8B7Y5A6_ACAPL|nr:uncharacterized protein LOC110978051 [Acanthaster planci]